MPTASVRAPEHLNNTGCVIRNTPDKGRGVFAAQGIPAQTVIDISPVLLFGKEEYATYGKHTVLDQYTFVWRDGQYALALGLGSLFNHSPNPNLNYIRDHNTASIKYITSREVQAGEELCIFYGTELWFEESVGARGDHYPLEETENEQDPLNLVDLNFIMGIEEPGMVIPEEDLPFETIDINNFVREEDLEAVRTVEAWVVDLPDPKYTATFLKWIKQARLDHPSLGHLRRARKNGSGVSVLLSSLDLHPSPPLVPLGMGNLEAYRMGVPAYPAITATSMQIKQMIWPVIHAPPRKREPEEWTAGEVEWAMAVMKQIIAYALSTGTSGEVPIASGVPKPYAMGEPPTLDFVATDARVSKHHPLRHSVINLIREVGETSFGQSEDPVEPRKTGSNYLLTSKILFATHEPCIMCSMALLHSRVAKVIYLIPMIKTGGCGGSTCLPRMEEVNHRFGVVRWKEGDWVSLGLSEENRRRLEVGDDLDA